MPGATLTSTPPPTPIEKPVCEGLGHPGASPQETRRPPNSTWPNPLIVSPLVLTSGPNMNWCSFKPKSPTLLYWPPKSAFKLIFLEMSAPVPACHPQNETRWQQPSTLRSENPPEI